MPNQDSGRRYDVIFLGDQGGHRLGSISVVVMADDIVAWAKGKDLVLGPSSPEEEAYGFRHDKEGTLTAVSIVRRLIPVTEEILKDIAKEKARRESPGPWAELDTNRCGSIIAEPSR